MGEIVKQLNDELRGKEYMRQSNQPKFLYKEFSRPVRAANHLENRLMLERIAKAAHLSKRNHFKYDRELDMIHELEKTLTIKSIDFDGEEFHKDHEKRRHFPFTKVHSVADILDRVPNNCVLEFGPGNQIIEKRPKSKRNIYTQPFENDRQRSRPPTRQGKQKYPVLSNNIKQGRSQSAFQRSTRKLPHGLQTRPNTSHFSRNPGPKGESSPTANRLTINILSLNRPMTGISQTRPSDSEGQFCTKKGSDTPNEDEHKSKSYRTLKTMFTYKEDNEPPVPDKKVESLKRLKAKEKLTFQNLDSRVKAFTKKLCKTRQ
ncbi:uncharacterized protein LOC133204745 [Saccostrea echinata]|uniref:uncharacterized protein LOC133204745 n=1 Tax=Saccostrea echinata TaxID=191078 RepID=UPI002A80F97F|nr:uncharacterized protein LOC133204745 [Saccostrea echinata]